MVWTTLSILLRVTTTERGVEMTGKDFSLTEILEKICSRDPTNLRSSTTAIEVLVMEIDDN